MTHTRLRNFRRAHARSRPRAFLLASSMLGLALGMVPLPGPAAEYESLAQLEGASETREYSQQVRDKKFAAEQEAFLRNVLTPQLALEANRPAITRTRQRLRELALRDAAKEVVEPVNSLLRDEMLKLAADDEAEPIVRVNAMLLVGELTGGDGKPWAGAVAALAAAAGDRELPPALRVAALAGLSGHVTAAAAGSTDIVPLAGPAIAGIVTNPPVGDPVAGRWLLARALDLLPAVAPPPAVVTAAATILADESADPDVRVRAASALGKLAKPEAGIDAPAAVAQIRALAIAALAADLAAAEERRFARKIGARDSGAGGFGGRAGRGFMPPLGPMMGPMMGPPSGERGIFGGPLGGADADPAAEEDAVPALACRRDAWRLYACAEAISPARSGPGLAELLAGDAQAAASDLAATLRQAALDLDAQPDEKTLEQAVAALRQATDKVGDAAAGPPAGRAQQPAASPFEQPAEKSPF